MAAEDKAVDRGHTFAIRQGPNGIDDPFFVVDLTLAFELDNGNQTHAESPIPVFIQPPSGPFGSEVPDDTGDINP